MEDARQAPEPAYQTALTVVNSSNKFTRVKKIITTLQVAVLAMGFAFALTGCREKTEPGPMENERHQIRQNRIFPARMTNKPAFSNAHFAGRFFLH